jgi:hypothetical protein
MGGVGLRSSVQVSPAAFVSSVASAMTELKSLFTQQVISFTPEHVFALPRMRHCLDAFLS